MVDLVGAVQSLNGTNESPVRALINKFEGNKGKLLGRPVVYSGPGVNQIKMTSKVELSHFKAIDTRNILRNTRENVRSKPEVYSKLVANHAASSKITYDSMLKEYDDIHNNAELANWNENGMFVDQKIPEISDAMLKEYDDIHNNAELANWNENGMFVDQKIPSSMKFANYIASGILGSRLFFERVVTYVRDFCSTIGRFGGTSSASIDLSNMEVIGAVHIANYHDMRR